MKSNIVEELRKTKNPFNLFLARSIEKRENSTSFRVPQDIWINAKNEDKAYSLFKRLIVKDSKDRLEELDNTISSVSHDIREKTGWWRTGNSGFRYEDNYINMSDPEFRSFDTYQIYRNENGYYTSSEEPFNSYFARIKMTEEKFLEKNYDKLQLIHEALSEKENMLAGDIPLQNEKNRQLVNEILVFLRYRSNEKEKVKTKIINS